MQWSVDTLAGLEGPAFEVERERIVTEFLSSVPNQQRREALTAQQIQLDLLREQVSHPEFMAHLAHQMAETLANLSDQFSAIHNNMVSR